MEVEFTLNGTPQRWDVHPGDRLLDVLRNHGYYGVKDGCSDGNCGACIVLMNGRPVNSCLVLAPRIHHSEITTIEGLGSPQHPHPIQTAFADSGAVQCGYCTPGSILSAYALLQKNKNPSESEIKRALDGNLCRCTGYVKKIRAIQSAARQE